jgi:hypothetical protein
MPTGEQAERASHPKETTPQVPLGTLTTETALRHQQARAADSEAKSGMGETL